MWLKLEIYSRNRAEKQKFLFLKKFQSQEFFWLVHFLSEQYLVSELQGGQRFEPGTVGCNCYLSVKASSQVEIKLQCEILLEIIFFYLSSNPGSLKASRVFFSFYDGCDWSSKYSVFNDFNRLIWKSFDQKIYLMLFEQPNRSTLGRKYKY